MIQENSLLEEKWYWLPGNWCFILMAISEVLLALVFFWGMSDKMLWQQVIGFLGLSFVVTIMWGLFVHPIDDLLRWLEKRTAE